MNLILKASAISCAINYKKTIIERIIQKIFQFDFLNQFFNYKVIHGQRPCKKFRDLNWDFTMQIIIWLSILFNQLYIKTFQQAMIQYDAFSPGKKTRKSIFQATNKDDYQVNLRSSLDVQRKNGVNYGLIPLQKIKSNPSFSLQRVNKNALQLAKSSMLPTAFKKNIVKLPTLERRSTINPEISSPIKQKTQIQKPNRGTIYYQRKLQRSLKKHETTYLMNLYRQHFFQTIQILRFGKDLKVSHPKKQLNLSRKNPQFKTIFLDLDQTLVHCDQRSNNYTVKLNFPLERGGIIAAGVRIRPFCRQFLQELSKFAQIIIFTASSSSYADVILDHLDPKKQYISHRMYRHNCTLEKGFYLKDLRTANRNLQDVALVDNSAYCHVLQPDNAIPMLPYFHYAKDKELESLLEYLRVLVRQNDMRVMLRQTFFYDKYINDGKDPRRVFLNNIQAMQKQIGDKFELKA